MFVKIVVDSDGDGVGSALVGSCLAYYCYLKQVTPPLATVTVGRGWWGMVHDVGQPCREWRGARGG